MVGREQDTAPEALAVARWCARSGWPVHPLAPQRKTPPGNCEACHEPGHTHLGCPCLAAGRWCHGFHAATLDPGRIRAWWGRGSRFGVGVACGPANLVVIDVDAHDAALPDRNRLLPGITIGEHVDLTGLASGYDSLALLAALRDAPDPTEDPDTLRVRTPSGGMHIWYRTPPTRKWLCSSGSSTGRALAWQVDVRGVGGYIVAPGTRTPTGAYTPVGTCRVPALLPTWLATELARTGHADRPQPPATPHPVPPRARLAVAAAGGHANVAAKTLATVLQEVADCALVSSGAAFNDKLNRAAYTAGGLVAAGHLDPADAERLLLEAAEHARPGHRRRSLSTIRGGIAAGRARPLNPGGRP
ncbi:bifunctional DNA primase/polymerase [Embleya sp. NBC_00896]|uniref:bifunctional DNA primase/polymerase n=1 Tax=Embleya sp. NBC_00896 TaxID=2975961 RepID=UPI003866EDB6|nr:bifunctional DNA primase/polymerase [Embleya sp. NBC_00896]